MIPGFQKICFFFFFFFFNGFSAVKSVLELKFAAAPITQGSPITIAIFTFSYLSVEKVVFLGQIFEMKALMGLHVLRSSKSKNHIFSVWSECLSVCMCLLSA